MSPPPTAESDTSGWLRHRLGIDARALAAFRVAVALLVIADLLFRARGIPAFYTDAGTLPRGALAAEYPWLAVASIHTVTGSAVGQTVLFLLSGLVALVLAVGYHTRLATAATAALHASLHARNPYLLNGGDALLVVLLALAVFLPLGERWSVDALRRDRQPRQYVASLATAVVLAQLVVVYLFNAVFKYQSEAWMRGEAVQYALGLEQFAVWLGPMLAAFPTVLVAVNWSWVLLLTAAPLLVVLTGWRRVAVVAAFAAAHFGMFVTMRLGLFPAVVWAILLLYLPSTVWDRIEAILGGRQVVSRTAVERLPSLPAPPKRLREGGRRAAVVVLVVVLVVTVVWPMGAAVDTETDRVDAPDYAWTLFSPTPPTETRWFVAPTTFETGETVDAFDGSAVTWDPPPDAAKTYASTLWHRYLNEMRFASDSERQPLGAYLCQQAAAESGEAVTQLTVYAVERPVEAVGGGEATRVELLSTECNVDTASVAETRNLN
ncbi:VKGC domain protein [Natronomonas pharaonis DSM 2160]|uniref:VKGC domain protein n=1 Tax=Natronomonas pharaonis (strain ATCC 35678 / DSM 2160 / CIP 103997 / JCM 8858 / NBRC 14720 / NCIMB 2260 / Gabara) TaxID=348780 RepID=A0A1U7EV45_NATPD|nr:HTTM domain-containing protein [Natronomonas pharaonis]CAI48880.1 VKGC domain protein [Natronomonas pharaonis DSM 2160]